MSCLLPADPPILRVAEAVRGPQPHKYIAAAIMRIQSKELRIMDGSNLKMV